MSVIRHRGGADEAADLVRHVQSCVAGGIARRALLVRLSRLPSDLARPHHLRLADEALEPLLMADRSRLFAMPNGDQVVIWRGDETTTLVRVAAELTLLFSDTQAPLDLETMIVPLALPEQADTLLQVAQESVSSNPQPAKPAEQQGAPLDLAALSNLEASLAQADVARFARRKSVVERRGDGQVTPRWEKRYLSAEEIGAELAPGHAVRADRWLFRRLSRTLDRRMLALLSHPEELRQAGPLSLNLNVGSILGPEFLRFDAALPHGLRGRVVIEVRAEDVICDLAAFAFARDFARARGYRLLLRGLTMDLLPVFPRERLGVDLLQLRWTPDLGTSPPGLLDDDAEAMVLAGARTAEALNWGSARGIRLFQTT